VETFNFAGGDRGLGEDFLISNKLACSLNGGRTRRCVQKIRQAMHKEKGRGIGGDGPV